MYSTYVPRFHRLMTARPRACLPVRPSKKVIGLTFWQKGNQLGTDNNTKQNLTLKVSFIDYRYISQPRFAVPILSGKSLKKVAENEVYCRYFARISRWDMQWFWCWRQTVISSNLDFDHVSIQLLGRCCWGRGRQHMRSCTLVGEGRSFYQGNEKRPRF